MRHGRKSASRRFDGHKLDVIGDEDSEMILGVDVRTGNAPNGEGAVGMLSQVQALPGILITTLPPTWPTPTATCARRWRSKERSS